MIFASSTVRFAAALAALVLACASASAQGTAEQRSACMGDAFQFCMADIPNVTAIELSDKTTPSELELVRAMAPRYGAIVVSIFVRSAAFSGRMDLAGPVVQLIRDLARQSTAERPLIAVVFGNPYVATFIPELPSVLLTYDFYDRAEASAVRALSGEAPIAGKLPITLGTFPLGHGLDRPASIVSSR